jgi:hypothetical protein
MGKSLGIFGVVATTLLTSASLAQSSYTLSRDGDQFVIHSPSGTTTVGLTSARVSEGMDTESPKVLAYRKDEDYAVWDSRGLTVRKGDQSRSFRFEEVPTDPKLFTPDEISKIQQDVRDGKKSLQATGLSGARRIGQRTLFLVRWTDSTNKPWLEALVQVDLDAKGLQPRVLGKLDGVTGTTLPIDNRLMILQNGVAAVVEKPSEWGVESYSFATQAFDYVRIGDHLQSWSGNGLYLERTDYGTTIGGSASVSQNAQSTLFEDRGKVEWLLGSSSTDVPVAMFTSPTGITLRNCATGLDQHLSAGAGVRRVPTGVLAWSPAANPTYAVLLSTDSWRRLAVWKSGG